MPSTTVILSAAASLAASAVLVRSIADELIPQQLKAYLFATFRNLSRRLSSQFTFVIHEYHGFQPDQIFKAADTYLGTRITPLTRRLQLGKIEGDKKLAVTLGKEEEVVDVFENVRLTWKLVSTQLDSSDRSGRHWRHAGDYDATPRTELRYYELSFDMKHNTMVRDQYLPYILERSKAIEEEAKGIKVHTVRYQGWNKAVGALDHPMTFKTLGIDEEQKRTLVEDLDNFISRKDYYRRVGKAWKRGYLLSGPPGTGKSSLVAAMANYLNFDIYDLDLSAVDSNTQLRFLLFSMANKSILAIEDIDCSIKLQNRESGDTERQGENKVTLSGLLNFIDGIWSSCGEGRIIVFTTNHKDRIDPALLRPGRMDKHIEMTYCTYSGFRQLASNYLGLSHHPRFKQIEMLLKEVEVTPAEVARELMESTNSEVSIEGLVTFLQGKRADRDEDTIKKQPAGTKN